MYLSNMPKRARPSRKSIVWSTILVVTAILLSQPVFLYEAYVPEIAMAVTAGTVSAYRLRALLRGMPEPHGRGKVTVIDEGAAAKTGGLLVVGGILSIVVLLGSIFLVGSYYVLAIMLGLAGGLPLSQLSYFAIVLWIEKRTKSNIMVIAEESTQDGRSVLIKTVEMIPES
ncbi:MAG: hypothetical protein HY296_01270 [Thaumarchaeota archaeon]|nr:hypothetical protein [Nitrososphaerota archaeon]